MNYFTHSSPRSWKPQTQPIAADAQSVTQQPGWLVQLSDEKPQPALTRNIVSLPLPFVGQHMELYYVGHFQDSACELITTATLKA